MVINLAPVSLSNKKVNFYTCPRLTFLKKNATENAYKSISEPLDFKLFLGGACSQTPLAARASSSETQGQIVRARESLKVFFVLYFSVRLDFPSPHYLPLGLRGCSRLRRSQVASSCSKVWLRPWLHTFLQRSSTV